MKTTYNFTRFEHALARKALVEAIDSIDALLDSNLPPDKKDWDVTDRSNFTMWGGRLMAFHALLKSMGGKRRGDTLKWKAATR